MNRDKLTDLVMRFIDGRATDEEATALSLELAKIPPQRHRCFLHDVARIVPLRDKYEHRTQNRWLMRQKQAHESLVLLVRGRHGSSLYIRTAARNWTK